MNNTNKTRGWNTFGIIIGVALIIVGVILPFAAVSINNSTQGWQKTSKKFGGDYYTYQYDATLDIIDNTASSAINSANLVKNLSLYTGIAFAAWGLLTIVHYGKALAETSDDNVSDNSANTNYASFLSDIKPIQNGNKN